MSNQAVNTRESMRLSSQNILGPPFLYDPLEYSISFLWRYQGTVLPMVFSSALFWFLVASHTAMLWAYHTLDGREYLFYRGFVTGRPSNSFVTSTTWSYP